MLRGMIRRMRDANGAICIRAYGSSSEGDIVNALPHAGVERACMHTYLNAALGAEEIVFPIGPWARIDQSAICNFDNLDLRVCSFTSRSTFRLACRGLKDCMGDLAGRSEDDQWRRLLEWASGYNGFECNVEWKPVPGEFDRSRSRQNHRARS